MYLEVKATKWSHDKIIYICWPRSFVCMEVQTALADLFAFRSIRLADFLSFQGYLAEKW